MKTFKTNGFVVNSTGTDGQWPFRICATIPTKDAAEKKASDMRVRDLLSYICRREVFVFEFKGEKYCVPVDKCTLIEKPEFDCKKNQCLITIT